MIDAHVHLEKGDYSIEWIVFWNILISSENVLKDYIDYIEKLKHINFPIRLKFGLEVCYSPEHEIDIDQMKQMYSFDFLVGSNHFIDEWAFSHLKQRWNKNDYDIDEMYEKQALCSNGMYIEESSGLTINYGDKPKGAVFY